MEYVNTYKLTSDQQYILSVLRESLGRIEEKTEPLDKHAAAEIIKRNGILLTVYQNLPAEIKAQHYELYLSSIAQAVNQDYEGKQVLKALGDSGFNCIALKGWELRKLYPRPAMRQMADIDILVQPYTYDKIKAKMEEIGFSGDGESSWKHDSFKKNVINVEMHKRLTDDSGVIQQWEKDMWSRAVRDENHQYRMSDEDYYIFHFIHLHKDFLNGSLGLRRIADTWLLQKQQIDRSFAESELAKMGLSNFHKKMIKLSRVTMGEAEIDEDTEILLTHACKHGIYGSDKSYKAGRIAAMGKNLTIGKMKSGIAAVFLPYKRMKAQFPVLEKWPGLLPYCWLKRIVRFLRSDMRKNKYMLDYSNVIEEDYAEMKRFFKAGGL